MVIHKDYPCNVDNYQRGRALPVSFLVFHYVGATGGARNNAKYYHDRVLKISAHYFVGHASEGAAIWQSVAEADTAWHCGRTDGRYQHPTCRNSNSIGIEMCCRQDASGCWYIDEATNEGKWAAFKARLEDTMTQEQFNSMMDTYLAQLREQKVSDWGKAAWNKATTSGIFDGTAPQAPLTREQAALVLDRLGLLEGR